MRALHVIHSVYLVLNSLERTLYLSPRICLPISLLTLNTVSAVRKTCEMSAVLNCGINTSSKHARKNQTSLTRVRASLVHTHSESQLEEGCKPVQGMLDQVCLVFSDFGFIYAVVGVVSGCKRNAYCNLSCLLQTYCHLINNVKTTDKQKPMAETLA